MKGGFLAATIFLAATVLLSGQEVRVARCPRNPQLRTMWPNF